MKNTLPILFLALFVTTSFGQAKKYLMLEHYTNTNCSICASRNPAFFDLIANYSDDIHHISIHPPYPYQQCIFYRHNEEENQLRADFYSIPGTPRVVWQGGQRTSPSSATAEKIEDELAETSPIEVIVEETLGDSRTVTVTVKTVGEQPVGNYKLLVAVVEKEIDYSAPNGEQLHHNVFRDMISRINGELITFAETGQEMSFTFDYDIHSEWNAEEIYALAWVQDFDIGDILNSGTRFDERTTATDSILPETSLEVLPNPARGFLNIRLQNIESQNNTVSLFDVTGKLVLEQDFNFDERLEVNNLARGMYLMKVQTEAGVATRKVVLK